MIDVYCDDESTRSGMHRGRVVAVVTFHHSGGRWVVYRPETWGEHHAHQGAIRQALAEQRVEARRMTAQEYEARVNELRGSVDDVPDQTDRRDARGDLARFDDRFAHTTYKLQCRLCGLDFQRHHEVVAPTLDQLHTAGVSQVSLTQLRAMVSE